MENADFVTDAAAADVWGPDQFWAYVPDEYKVAFFTPIFVAEWATESQKPHYTNSKTPGEFRSLVPNWWGTYDAGKEDVLKNMQLRELKNGRLAMIGIASFLAAEAVPGSVPLYPW